MTTDSFFKEYKIAILKMLLRDKDFNFKFYFDGELFESYSKDLIINNNVIEPHLPEILPSHVLQECIKNKTLDNVLNEKYIISPKNLEDLKHANHDFFNISGLNTVMWSDEIIELYKEMWYWGNLSSVTSIKWTNERIEKFKDYIDFASLSKNTSLDATLEFISTRWDKWDWAELSANPTLIKKFGANFFNLTNLVWRSKPTDKWNSISPSISSNKEIKWSLKLFEKYKDKIDFWVLSLYGNLDLEIIYKYGDSLNENRIVRTAFLRTSDWHDSHPVFRNGWENLLANENILVDFDFLEFISKKNATIIYHTGNAHEGFVQKDEIKSVNELNIDTSRLCLEFSEITAFPYLIPSHILSENNIEPKFWLKFIKPHLLNNKNLIKSIALSI